MLGLALGCVALGALYLLFAGQASVDEVAFGVVCAGLAAVWGALVLRAAPRRLRFPGEALSFVGRAFALLPVRTLAVGAALARAAVRGRGAGAVAARGFEPGREDAASDAGRRATVVLALSLTPDSFVVDIPAHREEIDLHRLIPVRERGDRRWPG